MSVHPEIVISRVVREGHVAISLALAALDRGDVEDVRSILRAEERRLRTIDEARAVSR